MLSYSLSNSSNVYFDLHCSLISDITDMMGGEMQYIVTAIPLITPIKCCFW